MFRFPLYLLLCFVLCQLAIGQNAMLGPVDLFYERMEQCDPELHKLDIWVTLRKFNRTVNVLDIQWNSSYPVDDAIEVELKGSLKKEGGYKPGAFYFKDKACKALQAMLGEMFPDVLHSADPSLDSCPLPAGAFEALGFYFDNKKFDVPQIYGEYMMEIYIYKEEELQSCYIVYYEMRAKD